jgi:hypothetical protein
MSTITRKNAPKAEKPMDHRDRLILALYAQLKAERETRDAMEWAIGNGALSTEVLQAMVSDPVPVITDDDVTALERLLAGDRSSRTLKH